MFRLFSKQKNPSDAETASNRLKQMVAPRLPKLQKEIEKLLAKFYTVKCVEVKVKADHLTVNADI